MVAKFEASVADQNAPCYISSGSSCNKTTLISKMIPNFKNWRYISVGNAFDVALKIKNYSIYGWKANEIDTHLMKNTEWGAVAYLTQSVYGANNKIWPNTNNTNITGCSGSGTDVYNQNICNEYHTSTGQKASTTHNIYGVYDMSGGAHEFVAAYVNNGHSNLTNYGLSLINAPAKYKNVYVSLGDTRSGNYEVNKNIYGDAIYETSSSYVNATTWYRENTYMPYSEFPWFSHDGYYFDYSAQVGVFNFWNERGYHDSVNSFRPVVIPLN